MHIRRRAASLTRSVALVARCRFRLGRHRVPVPCHISCKLELDGLGCNGSHGHARREKVLLACRRSPVQRENPQRLSLAQERHRTAADNAVDRCVVGQGRSRESASSYSVTLCGQPALATVPRGPDLFTQLEVVEFARPVRGARGREEFLSQVADDDGATEDTREISTVPAERGQHLGQVDPAPEVGVLFCHRRRHSRHDVVPSAHYARQMPTHLIPSSPTNGSMRHDTAPEARDLP